MKKGMQTTVKLMALLLLLLIPNIIQAEQKPWEHGRLQVCGFHLGLQTHETCH